MPETPVAYETPAEHVARIVLNRPEARNAQDTGLLYALNDAFDRAARDDATKVIILAAVGPHFSSGHDLREGGEIAEQMAPFEPVGTWCGFGCAGAEGRMAREKEIYLGLSERWRNIPKPTIAAVQGKCISGGLMLAWPCDLIVAAEDALFCDNTVGLGVGGVEYFAHPWEVGPRKAKELLFTADWLTAHEARALGMVNQVVPAEELQDRVLDLAKRIATKPMFALKLAKEAVNAAEDAQGRVGAMGTAFALHQLAHSHNMQVHGRPVDPSGIALPKRG
ncbi:enoyl-CoA hydratase [Phenylobacterium sp. J367]|uniref:enoyl-CoA hydratase n=1 Tax=Phenylobacterium sp. J367 TaxID=2898435 RepID=UPI0021512699|nr:enoyl-CoA hydratase [Phenylobacterium sp. J367]MCR5879743.1 enoyl-CoA hydratase [Phenylobacterium sp. J367]